MMTLMDDGKSVLQANGKWTLLKNADGDEPESYIHDGVGPNVLSNLERPIGLGRESYIVILDHIYRYEFYMYVYMRIETY